MATHETIVDGSTGGHNTTGGYCEVCENKPCTHYIDIDTIPNKYVVNYPLMIAPFLEIVDGRGTVGVVDGGEWLEKPSRVIDGDGSLIRSLLGEDGMDKILPNLLTEDLISQLEPSPSGHIDGDSISRLLGDFLPEDLEEVRCIYCEGLNGNHIDGCIVSKLVSLGGVRDEEFLNRNVHTFGLNCPECNHGPCSKGLIPKTYGLIDPKHNKIPEHTYGPSCFAGSCLGGVCSKAATQDSSHTVADPDARKYNNLLLVLEELLINNKTFTAEELVPDLEPNIVTCEDCGFAIGPEENHKCTKPL